MIFLVMNVGCWFNSKNNIIFNFVLILV